MLSTFRSLCAAAAASAFLAASPASARDLPDFADLVEQVGPAVINIRTTARIEESMRGVPRFPLPEGMDENDPFFEFFRRFFPPRDDETEPTPPPRGQGPGDRGRLVPRGVGSGFILSSDGYVMTNHHVVDKADEIVVTLNDRREFKARLIGSDRRTDVAVVKIDATDLPSVKIGDPERIRVGQWVLAIGSPFGLENTVTAGIVSAKGRETGEYLPFIQTDVAVNPGNSGGPLINMDGEVIGINSQIYSRTGGFMGISFAIPINEAMSVADQIRATGRVVRGRIGVGIAEVTKAIAEPLGLPDARGALVRNVAPDGPAEAGGVQAGDIILQFNGRRIESASDLPRIVGSTKPGTTASLEVWRKGSRKQLTLKVGEMSPDAVADAGRANEPPEPERASAATNKLGLGVSSLPEDRARELRLRSGVVIEAVEGPARESGLRPGDILLQINNTDIDGIPRFNATVAKLEPGKTAVLLVQRGDAVQFVPITP